MLEGGRLVVVFFLVFLLTETGVQIIGHISGWCGSGFEAGTEPGSAHHVLQEDHQDGKKEVLSTITSHCLPKLVCQLYTLQSREHISQSERHLINLIGSAGVTGSPSKYTFAAHMGQLVRGLEGHGCHNFYPNCPFSNHDVMEIAKRINFK